MEQESFVHAAIVTKSIQTLRSDNIALKEQVTKQQEESQKLEINFREKIDLMQNKLATLSDNFSLISVELIQAKEDLVSYKELLAVGGFSGRTDEEHGSCARDIEKLTNSHAQLSSNLSELDLKQQLMDNTNYSGRMIWKIDNYSHRLQQAVMGTITVLHSAPCFTGIYGYKFCARLYLNGDGMGKRTHMSLFFVPMKSEYDDLLEWPFGSRVTFRLINQSDASKSIKETSSGHTVVEFSKTSKANECGCWMPYVRIERTS